MLGSILIEDVESRAKNIDFGSYFSDLLLGHISTTSNKFKESLIEFDELLKNETSDLSFLKDLAVIDLKKILTRIERINEVFDKLNDLYYSSSYFNDSELKVIFRSLTRKLHKIENLSYKYLIKDSSIDSTPLYIKEGLSDYSRENIAKKIISGN
jgi:hypothetical protein